MSITSNKKNTLIFFIIYMAYMSIYIARVNLSIAGPDLISENILDSAQIGTLGSFFFVAFATGRIINGTLSDVAPPYLMLTVGLAFVGISNILMGFLPPFIAMILFQTINAYAQSMLWSSVLCAVSVLYDSETVKKKTSLMVTSVATGNIMGIIVNTFVITHLNVRFAFIVPGITTMILGIFTFAATKNLRHNPKTASKRTPIRSLLKNKELLTMNVVAIIHGVMKENISLWMAVYIVDTYLVDLTQSSLYILLIPIIGLAGRLIYPFIYNLCKENENTVSFTGFAVCVAATAVLCFGKINIFLSVLALGIIYMSVSVINTSLVSIYPLSYAKTGNTASVSGIMDFSTYFGAGISSLIYGHIIKNFGYFPMFVSWVVLSCISILIIINIKKRRKEENNENFN